MNYFEITENISTTDEMLRVITGAALLLATPTAIAADIHPALLPTIAVYLILTGIMKWDPIGYVLEIGLRMFGSTPTPTTQKPPARMHTSLVRMHPCRGG